MIYENRPAIELTSPGNATLLIPIDKGVDVIADGDFEIAGVSFAHKIMGWTLASEGTSGDIVLRLLACSRAAYPGGLVEVSTLATRPSLTGAVRSWNAVALTPWTVNQGAHTLYRLEAVGDAVNLTKILFMLSMEKK